MVSKTVLCAIVLALVAVSYARPHHEKHDSEKHYHQHSADGLYSETITIAYEHGPQHDRHHKMADSNEEDSSYAQRRQQEHKKRQMNMEEVYDESREMMQRKEAQHVKGSGKINSCDDETYDDGKPCVMQRGRKNKRVDVQDTSSEEIDMADRKVIRTLTSEEDSKYVDLRQGEKPTPVHQGKWAQEHSYSQVKPNYQQHRRGQHQQSEFEQSWEHDNSQKLRNKLSKH